MLKSAKKLIMDASSKDLSNDPNKLVIVEEFLLAIKCSNHGQPEILETAINIDLAEFDFTPQELEEIRKLFQKLNFALSDAFSEVCPAASVMTEAIECAGLAICVESATNAQEAIKYRYCWRTPTEITSAIW